jgi:hypothetical protein
MDEARLHDPLTRRAVVRLAAAGAFALGLLPGGAAAAETARPRLRRISIRSTKPFRGDRPLFATVSPGSPTRDRVRLRFRLDRAARVKVEAIRTNVRGKRPIWSASARLPKGSHRFLWKPDRDTPPGTYVMRMTVEGDGKRVVYGERRPRAVDLVRAPVVRVLGIEAAFASRSYAPGQLARLRVSADTHRLSIQVFRAGAEGANTDRPDEMKGVAMAPPRRIRWDRLRHRRANVAIRIGDWPTGLYFARLIAADGRRGYAPFIVRPGVFGKQSRELVVLPTYTWQAYNYRDANGDGWGDTWYAGGSPPVRLDRPFLHRGVPPFYRRYDLAFLRWLHQTDRHPDVISEEDLGRFSGEALRRHYDLICFPGHTEYVTEHEYAVIEKYRDLGGNLIFLSANNFFWKVRRSGDTIRRVALWRDLERPEVRVLGTQYRANDDGTRQGHFVITGYDVAPWAFGGIGSNGGTIGHEVGGYGIEIDATTPDSPPNTHILAAIPDLFGPGVSAHMTYYEHASGAKVFSAGVLDFGGSIAFSPTARRLVENVWRHLDPG